LPLYPALSCAVLAAALACAGCESLGVALGLRERLDKVAVTGIEASLAGGQTLAPGQSTQLVIVASTADGQKLTSVGAGGGKVVFDSFHFDPTRVQVKASGKVTMPKDPRLSDGPTPQVHISVVSHPEVVTDLAVPPRYDAQFTADFSGHDGRAGFDGMSGSDGSSGASGSTDLTTPAAGGQGGNGSDGQDGSNGWPGDPGPAVRVWMTLHPGAHPLLEVRVAAATEQFFLVDPAGGSLTVRADGGSGGRAGTGGRGGRGGAGGAGWPPGMSGLDGRNGADGAAGTISVMVDPAANPYLGSLILINKSGAGAPGPAPRVQVAPVAALW
jgi:hypothetical protein